MNDILGYVFAILIVLGFFVFAIYNRWCEHKEIMNGKRRANTD